MSVVLFPPQLAPPARDAVFGCAWLTALGAVATAEIVTTWTGLSATIKWPNDVLVDGRKIAGILVERALASHQQAGSCICGMAAEPRLGAVIGIGLNVNVKGDDLPPDLAARATSLQIQRGAPADRSEVARDLIRRLDHWYDASQAGGAVVLSAPWRARSEHLGKTVRVVTPSHHFVGRLVDLDLDHGLTLALEPAPGQDSGGARPPALTQLALAEILTIESGTRTHAVLS
jgi:BirA family biotin operon repressor/biotin-[acetyl-CoA-carboxylase] ligase